MEERRRLAILGGGISGYGTAVLAQREGFEVFVSDSGPLSEKIRTGLTERQIRFEEGGHTEELILNADEAVKSPGIPDKAPIVRALAAKGVPVISEIEFAARYTNARTICVTGSNGKTTTAALTHRMLADAGFNAALGGNIGESFALQVAEGGYDWFVLELSSFQLDGTKDFRPDIAVLTNITPDHLDRYNYSFDCYAESKMAIIRNQRESDNFIYCADDPKTAAILPQYRLDMRQLPFSLDERRREGAWFADGMIRAKVGGERLELDASSFRIRGRHNIYNMMAAAMAAMAAGVPAESIVRTAASFEGIEHRLQSLGEIDGVEYIDDSKATNVDSAWYALESMTRPVIWIAGGTDKGNDYEPLFRFAPKIKALVCMGVNNEKLVKTFRGLVGEIHSAHTFEDAMKRVAREAEPGDVVLLSPACASFDLFENYEQRGRMFADWVNGMKKELP